MATDFETGLTTVSPRLIQMGDTSPNAAIFATFSKFRRLKRMTFEWEQHEKVEQMAEFGQVYRAPAKLCAVRGMGGLSHLWEK